MLLAVGPHLAGLQPTDGELLPFDGSGERNIAPRDLTFKFDEDQRIDPATLDGIRIVRSGLDGEFTNDSVLVQPGHIAVGDAPNENEVTVRFAETLPDDLYRVELYGIDDVLNGITALRNTRTEAFGDATDDGIDNGSNSIIEFELNLGPQVVAVVPQPVARIADPNDPNVTILSQAREQIVVYFNDDDLFAEDDATGNPTQRSAENPDFYRLIFTGDTVENTDDITILPDTVQYDPTNDTATLTFAQELDALEDPGNPGVILGPGTFRLRVGTDEALPLPPQRMTPDVGVTTDFDTGGAADVTFTATGDFARAANIRFTENSLGAVAPPNITVVDNTIYVELNTDGGGTTAAELKAAIDGDAAASGLVSVSVAADAAITGSSVDVLRIVGLGSSFDTASDLGPLGNQSLLLSSSIDPQEFLLDLPGATDEPGHRDIPSEIGSGYEQHVNPAFGADTTAGVTTIQYNFRQLYGVDAQGNPLSNLITEEQKLRVREAVELWGKQLGVQFLETTDQGLTFVTGDPGALDPNDPNVLDHAINPGPGADYDFIARVDPTFTNSMLILDSDRQWNSRYAGDWFERVVVGLGAMLGLQRANDLPVTNLMAYSGASTGFFGNTSPEPIYPGNADVIHGQYVHRPDSNDIDLYRFTIDLNDQDLDEKKQGLLTVESYAERLPNSSQLDTVLSLYREVAIRDENEDVIGFERELIARNDDYYSSDAYVSLELGSGAYYIGMTASGNTDFDPVIEDTGFGGASQGDYELRLNFRSQVDDDDVISDLDRIAEDRPGTPLDGDADGEPGGVYNFWFQTRPLQRVINVSGDGNTYVDGQTLTLTDAFGAQRRFEFDSNGSPNDPTATQIPFVSGGTPTLATDMAIAIANAINASSFGISAAPAGTSAVLTGDRTSTLTQDAVGVELAGKTIFVDKTSGANLDGTLVKPFDNISIAFDAAVPGDIVRIVGNGGFDGDRTTLDDNFAYEIGFGSSGGPAILTDGSAMSVPKGVTAMIDAGAILKLRRAQIGVGSSSASVDRSVGALQVLGTPHESVHFTSWHDETIGHDTHAPTTTPAAGDWGGILFRADLDNAEARFNYEDEGIFLNYVNHADVRFGGGTVRIDTVDTVVNPIQMVEMRPTVTFNSITESSDAALSADPNSFEETNFHSPRFQFVNEFTSDYERIGPEIHGNHLVDNSINGLFVRIKTPAGTELRSLTVPGRFDDVDVVHVLAENLKISGQPGEALLEVDRPPVDLLTFSTQVGGNLAAATYDYKLVFVDENGFEGRPSEATDDVVLPAGKSAIQLNSLPPVNGNFVSRRLYRSQPGGDGPYNLIADLDADDTKFVDDGSFLPSLTENLLERDPPSVMDVTLTESEVPPGTATNPGVSTGIYNYRVVFVDSAGNFSPASDPTADINVNPPADPLTDHVEVRLDNLSDAPAGQTKQIYRSSVGGSGPYVLAGEIAAAVTTFTDDGTTILDANGGPVTLDPTLFGVIRARPDARLKIDPGTVVKLEGARIEVTFGAQLIAEGFDGQEVIFTSKLDDRYGAGGTFDTNEDDGAGEADPSPGNWGGIFIGPLGQLNIDHAYIAYGGGDDNKIEGTFKGFNVIELHQADARIANSVIEHNDPGTGGQGPNDRFGRGSNEAATIFVRGSQPVILNNVIRHNASDAIDINVDTFTHQYIADSGRATGPIDQETQYVDNQGPFIRGNRLDDNGLNGMKIRTAGITGSGAMTRRDITLSTESVWDDADIVHVLYNEILVSDYHLQSGLYLNSSPNESLVVKLSGGGAGFTATGRPLEMEDRIGGTLYVIGQPGFPVVLTSLRDDTVGAGIQPDGTPQTDTDNNGISSTPSAGDWRSVRLDQFSHDRNVEMIIEMESPSETAPGPNGTLNTAQFLGDLASSEYGGDNNLRLGFQIQGLLNEPGDVDVYSFTAEAGTEIWFDVDRSTYALDTVIDVLDANGVLIAQSNNSQDETVDSTLLFSTAAIPDGDVNPLQRLPDPYQPQHASGVVKDFWTTNPRDAGMRVVLPGAAGQRSPYMFRVRSSSLGFDDPAGNLQDPNKLYDGLTSGIYQLQVRTGETDEVPGSTVRFADIRYAQNAIEVIGLPAHSPLLGEAAEDELVDPALANNGSIAINAFVPGNRPQDIGNLFNSDRATLSIAGALASSTDVDFYQFEVEYDAISNPSAHHGSLVFDVDYADGLSRPDTVVAIFDDIGTPILIGRDSNISEDRPAPLLAADDQSGMKDLPRGSVGELDPFIGTVELPEGTYFAAVMSARYLPAELVNNPATRLEPIDSVVRIAEDHIGTFGGSTAEDPVIPFLLDPTFDGTTVDPNNLWHVSTREAPTSGHGLTPAFDGSRLGITAGSVSETEANDTIATAQSLENVVWSLDFDTDIGDFWTNTSTTIPHMTVTSDAADNNDTFDYYSFVVTDVPARGIFDIDYGITGNPLTDVDTDLVLFDAAGNSIGWGPSVIPSAGADGSTSVSDGWITTTFTTPGTYVIGVGEWPSFPGTGGINGQPVPAGVTYTLQVSIEDHAATTTTGNGGETFYFGDESSGTYIAGTGGSLLSNAFSLKNYSAEDRPVLYFNYKLDTAAGDDFRVYMRMNDTSEELVASSNAAEVNTSVLGLTDDAVWRQSRIELDDFAGLDQLRLRYDFQGVAGGADGVHIDDVVIGFAERGEMITEATNNTTFYDRVNSGYVTSGRTLDGEYQLEIRKATDYATSSILVPIGGRLVPGLILDSSFDTNDRHAQQLSIVAPGGLDVGDGQTFVLGDGSGFLTFEFEDLDLPGGDPDKGITPGNVQVGFRAGYTDDQVAESIRDAINSPSVQSTLDIQAGLSDGTTTGTISSDNIVNLYGNAVGDFFIRPTGAIQISGDPTTDGVEFANKLRDAILGDGVTATPLVDAAYVGGSDATDGTFTSAGFFTGGLSSIGMDSGIILSTGDVEAAGAPNADDSSSAVASGAGDVPGAMDPGLDVEFGVATSDVTSLEFQFRLLDDADVYFNFVFASEEYNELVGSPGTDSFAVFVDGVNVALVPGVGGPVSRENVNGGNPLGTAAQNPLLYNNNDPNDSGLFLGQLGYDGFTDVFTASTPLLAGDHWIRIAVADVGGTDGDSAVFVQGGTLGTGDPSPVSPPPIVGIQHDGFGDANHFRDQGQVLIHSNTITDPADFGIVADAGERDVAMEGVKLGQSHMGPVRNLRELNNIVSTGAEGGLVPGVTIVNNTISGGGLGGIHFSGNLRVAELTIPRPEAFPDQSTVLQTSADAICDGDVFVIRVGRTTVEFEFEDIARSPAIAPTYTCPLGGAGANVGWTPGRVPVNYRRTIGAIPGMNQSQVAGAIRAAINSSILVNNGTTLVAEVAVADSRALGDPVVGPDPAVYVEHAAEVLVRRAHSASRLFGFLRVADIGHAPQPFGRIVNNTIFGNDGNYSFFPDSAVESLADGTVVNPNDTILNAVDTRQGRSQSPEMYTAANVTIGDTASFPLNPEADVDFYQFQLDIGDHVRINVNGTQFTPVVRLFNSKGEEFIPDGSGNPVGVPTIVTAGNNVTVDMYVDEPNVRQEGYNYAIEGDTYYVAVSGEGNDEYSPLSLGSRIPATASGPYAITVNVMAPRKWVIDTAALVNTAGSYEVYDVDGNMRTITGGGVTLGQNTPVVVGQLAGGLGGLRGVSSSGLGSGGGRRYLVIQGASRVVQITGPGNTLTTNNNNDDGVLPETGILVSEESTPTLLNNVLSNTRNGVVEAENQLSQNSPRTAVVGANLFQHNLRGDWSVSRLGGINPEEGLAARPSNNDFNVRLGNSEPLFVNAPDGNLFPAELARSIDSSVDSLEDRPQFIHVKAPMGIANSPILAPERDATGQLRVDDPDVAPPQGQGADVFKDRGSLDRSDFVGPAAVLLNPRDNDAGGNDIDPTGTVVHLLAGTYDNFLIQVVDGFESADPFPGVGVNDDTILGPVDPEVNRLPGAAITVFEDGVYFEEGFDYSYRYDTTSNTIRLTPLAGVWPEDKVYVIRLNNRDRFVINAPRGDQTVDGDTFTITDDGGATATFEYDSGFNIQIPQSLTIQVPTAGVTDGQRFTIRDASDPLNPSITFETDVNGVVLPGNIPVRFPPNASQDEIADALVTAFTGGEATAAGLQMETKNVGGGLVHLGAPEYYMLNMGQSALSQALTVLAIAVPEDPAAPNVARVTDQQMFTIDDGASIVTFEFDFDGAFNPANTPVDLTMFFGPTPTEVGFQIEAALALSGLNLADTAHVGNGVVHVTSNPGATADVSGTFLYQGNASRPVRDGEAFVVSYNDDGNPATPDVGVTFEFDMEVPSIEGTSYTTGNRPIPFALYDTHAEVGQKLGAAIHAAAALNLPDAKHLENGLVHLGGTTAHDVDLTLSPTLELIGRPDAQTTTTLNLPGLLTILLPTGGGADITDGDTFSITDLTLSAGAQTQTFEFFDGIGSPVLGNTPVDFVGVDDGQLAQNIINAINSVVVPGETFLAGVTPSLVPGGVELTGANSNHDLDTNSANNVERSGGRVADGESFTISYQGNSTTFEFDVDGTLNNLSATPILFTATNTLDEVANAMVAAIRTTPSLALGGVENGGDGAVLLNDTSRHITSFPADTIPVENSLVLTGIPGGAVRLPYEPWSGFTGDMFAQVIIGGINVANLDGVAASLRGGNTVFVDFVNTTTSEPADFVTGFANVTGISNYFLRAIQDLPGNWLKANQFTNETQFTILMPGADLDFGDARVTARPSQYPTLFVEDGARHVITVDGPHLGNRVDGDPDGQLVPAAFGDDLDQIVDVRESSLTITGNAPLTIRVPAGGVPDAGVFEITTNGVTTRFEFDEDGNGIHFDSHEAIVYPAGATTPQIAEALVAAVGGAGIGLRPVHLGAGVVSLGGQQLHSIDTSESTISTEGLPAYLIRAVAGIEINEASTFTISDGVEIVPTIFEFDRDGFVAAGNVAVTYTTADNALTVAGAIETAVTGQGLALTLTDLGDGTLHVRGAASHAVDFTPVALKPSTLDYAGQTPLTLSVPAAGLGFELTPSLVIQVRDAAGGGLADGETFEVADGTNTVLFEFDSTGVAVNPNARIVTFALFDSGVDVATAIRDAIDQAVTDGALTGLTPTIGASAGGYIPIDLGAGILHSVDANASGLLQEGAVSDGETFEVNDGANPAVTFEFDSDASVVETATLKAIDFQANQSANGIANAIVAAINGTALVGLEPKNLTRGNIQVGGEGSVDATLTANLSEAGTAGGVLDGKTFHLLDGTNIRRFEFEADGKATPGNIRIAYNVTSTAGEIADAMVAAIRNSGFAVNVVHLGGGQIAMDGDDEDGVRFDRVFTAGSVVPITVTASGEGYLDLWIDFNGDGDWLDQFEKVFATSVHLEAGENELMVPVPVAAGPGETYARFRFSSQGGLSPTGLAIDGEVEDYRIQVISNDPPEITVPGPQVTDEDVSLVIAGMGIADPDAMTATVEVTMSVVHGTLTVNEIVPGGLIAANITDNGTGLVVLSGTLSQINNTLANSTGLTYLNVPQHYNGDDRLTVVADDLGNSGTGGPQQDVATVLITVNPVNDAPEITAPFTETATEDLDLVISGISIVDVDIDDGATPGQMIVTLQVASGTITVNDSVFGGLAATDITDNGTATVTLTGGLTEINATLAANVTYHGNLHFDVDDALVITADDQGSTGAGGSATGTSTTTINITADNDAPVVTVPTSVTANEDTPLGLAGFDVADVDSAAADITVTLTVSGRNDSGTPNGILTINDLSASGGVDPATQVTANGTSSVTIIAPVAAISTTLSDSTGWTYTPPLNFAGNSSSANSTDWAYEILELVANDNGATSDLPLNPLSDTEQVTLFVDEINDPPTVDVTGVVTTTLDEDSSLSIGPISVADIEANPATDVIQVSLKVLSGTVTVADLGASSGVPAGGISGNGTSVVGLTGTVDQINITLGTAGDYLVYQGNLNFNDNLGAESLVITANDQGISPPPPKEGTGTISLTVTALNDPPTVSVPGPLSVNEDTDLSIPLITVADPDAAEGIGDGVITVKLDVTDGTLMVNQGVTGGLASGDIVTSNGGKTVTLTGTVDKINTTLADPNGVIFRGALNASGPVTLTVTADDGEKMGAIVAGTTDIETVDITVVADNDAPIITVPATVFPNPPLLVNEDEPLVINGISVDDVDAGSADIQVTLTAVKGTIGVDDSVATGVPAGDISGNGSNSVVLTGSLTEINDTLGVGVTYTGVLNYNGIDELIVRADDRGNAPPPAESSEETISISITPINDPPVISGLGAMTVNEDVPFVVPPINITDVDVAETTIGGLLTVDLSVNDGTLAVDLTVTNGVTSLNVSNNGQSAVTITATPDAINTTFAAATGLTYTPNLNFNSGDGNINPDELTVTADDGGRTGTVTPAGNTSDSQSVPITVVAVNDAPVLNLPDDPLVSGDELEILEDNPLVIPFAANTVGDVDATEAPGSGLLHVVLAASFGDLTVSMDHGLVINDFDNSGNAGSTVGFTALEAVINATLSNGGVTYQPNANFNGIETITALVDDLGNTDATLANPLTDQGSFTIAVAPVNDAPELTVPPSPLAVNEDTDLALSGPAFHVGDVDAAEGTGEVSLNLQVFNSTITVDTNVPGGVGAADIQGNGLSNVTLTGTPAQINATLDADGVVFRGVQNFSGQTPLILLTSDKVGGLVNYGLGGEGTDDATLTINVNSVNDAPTVIVPPTNPTPLATNEDTSLTITGVGVNDVDAGVAEIEVKLTAGNGTVTVGGSGPSSVVTLTGSQADINSTLAGGIVYRGNPDVNGIDTITVTANDKGNSPTPEMIGEGIITVSVNAVNDAPIVGLPVSLSIGEDTELLLSGSANPNKISVTDVDSGSGNIVVTLDVTNGTLTVNPTVGGGLTQQGISGSGTGHVVLIGTAFAIFRTLSDDFGLSYQGNSDFFGSDTLIVTADDRGNTGDGGALTDAKTATITVTGVNDAPEVVNPIQDRTVNEDAPETLIELFPAVFADVDDSSLTLTVTGNDNTGLVDATVTGTQLTLDYQPNRYGTAEIKVRATDDDGAWAEDTFTVTVNAIPDPPFVANPIADVTVQEGTPNEVVDLTGVFDDPDIPPDSLTVSYNDTVDNTNRNLVTGSLTGLTLTLTFTPGLGGRADLTVHATDQQGQRVSNTFAVNVNATPVARDDTAVTNEGTPVAIIVVSNDTDADGVIDPNSVTIVPVSGPSNGTLTISGGVVTYTPDLNFPDRPQGDSAEDSFRYTVRDDDEFLSNEATVTITVNEVPDFKNPLLATDVNRSGQTSPLDALILINYINANGFALPPDPVPPAVPQFFYDVNGDNEVTSADVLAVVLDLNALAGGEGEEMPGDALAETSSGGNSSPTGEGEALGLLVVPDYSLLAPVASAVPSTAAETQLEPTSAVDEKDVFRTSIARRANASPVRDSAFDAIGSDSGELIDLAMDDILSDIADDVDDAGSEQLAADWVLSGRDPKNSRA